MKQVVKHEFKVGERVTVQGYHKSYQPEIVEIREDGMVRLRTVYLVESEVWCKLSKLEQIKA